jgi:hypothetical protein
MTMPVLHSLLMILAFVCLVLAAFEVKSSRVNLQAAGLAFWVLSLLLP